MELVSVSTLKMSVMLVLCIAPILNNLFPLPVFILGKNKIVTLSAFQQGQHYYFSYYY